MVSWTGLISIYSERRATVLTDSLRAIDVLAEYHGNVYPLALRDDAE